MRFLSLNLLKYGCFTDRRFDFAISDGQIHVVYGSNEAGKSTALRALTGFLYGIHPRTTDDFRHDKKDLRIEAEVERADGTRRTFVRRKGSRDTLLNSEGKAVADASLADFLGGATSEIFGNLYRMDHASLVEGGNELLKGEGDLAKSLYQAGTGITRLREVLAGLEDEADQLFKPHSSKSLVHRAVESYDESRKRSRELSVSPKGWSERIRDFETKSAELRLLKEKLSNLQEQLARWNRFQLAMPHVTRRKELTAEIQSLKAVSLPDTAAKERETVERSRQSAEECRNQAERKHTEATEEFGKWPEQGELLRSAPSISDVWTRLDSFRQAQRDLPKVQAEQRRLETDSTELLRQLRPELLLDAAHTLHLTIPQQTRIRTLATDYPVLFERLRSAQTRVESTAQDLEQSQRALEPLPPAQEARSLRIALDQIRLDGDLANAERKASDALTAISNQVSAELSRLSCWKGTLADLESAPIPSVATVEACETEMAEIRTRQGLLNGRKDQVSQRLSQLESQIRALQISGAVPTEAELEIARVRRDHGWELVRLGWQEGAELTAPSELDPGVPLADAYERSVVDADSIADRLRREADRVATLASLLADKEVCAASLAELETDLVGCSQSLTDCQRRWTERWEPAGMVPLSPKEMRSWLTQYQSVLVRGGEMRQAEQSLAQLQSRITEHRQSLVRVLEQFGAVEQDAASSLPSLIQLAEANLERLTGEADVRAEIESEIKSFEREHNKAVPARDAAGNELSEWKNDWNAAIAPLALPHDTRAAEAAAVLDNLDVLFGKLAESESLRIRIEDMQQHIAAFTLDVKSLVEQLAPELENLPPEHSAAQLQELLSKAQQDSVRRQGAEAEIKKQQGLLNTAESDLQLAEGELRRLLARASCADVAALQEAERQSAQDRALRKSLDQTNETLATFTGGATFEEFICEIDTLNVDQLLVQIDELKREQLQIDERRSESEQHLGSERTALDANKGSQAAAAAAEDAQAALAGARLHAEHHIRLRLAAEVLRRHIERYRAQNQDPIIQRAAEIFPRLTAGSFAGLRTGFDEKDHPILLGVRPTGEEVDVPAMSDGTRDQLFLALRLASLEQQLRSGEPLPFVVDDILVNFDDKRAQATLSELAETARATQVLFFTHHSRLVELARAVVPAERLAIHEI